MYIYIASKKFISVNSTSHSAGFDSFQTAHVFFALLSMKGYEKLKLNVNKLSLGSKDFPLQLVKTHGF